VSSYIIFAYDKLFAYTERFFEGCGFKGGDAESIAKVLLKADLCGIESHGFARIPRYDDEISSGQVEIGSSSDFIQNTPLAAVVDGRKAFGQLTAVAAMEHALLAAKKYGVGMVSVRNSNHFGIASYYTNMAVEEDFIGICMTNSEAIMVPTFGRRAMLGTNALAFAMPASPYNFSFDGASSVVPRGKIEVYEKNGLPLPEGWAIDAEGKPTLDAGEVIAAIIAKKGGGIAPLGGTGEAGSGYKGYGLGIIVEILSAVLSGGLTSNHVNVRPGEAGMCHFFAALDYGIFGDKPTIKNALSAFLQELRDSPRAEGQARIYTHGERAAETEKARLESGIPVSEKTLLAVNKIANRRGLSELSPD
jgi:LDH2 family malate/lactate/ureidoglycolate dehydrogenase